MRADIHDGPEHMLQSETEYIDARPLNASSTKPLATHGRTIQWVKSVVLTLRRSLPVFPDKQTFSPATCPVSSDAGRSGGFALFPSRFDPVRRGRHERRIVMGAGGQPGEVEDTVGNLLFGRRHGGAVLENQQ